MDWVTARILNRPEAVFDDLRQQVESDVEAIRNAPPNIRHDRQFVFFKNGEREFGVSVHAVDDANARIPCAKFNLIENQIRVYARRNFLSQDNDGFDVDCMWDSDRATCDLKVDNKAVELWKISERALVGWFFDPNMDDL